MKKGISKESLMNKTKAKTTAKKKENVNVDAEKTMTKQSSEGASTSSATPPKDIHPNLTPWKPGQSGNPKGRPKKIYTILKKTGYNKDDIKTAFGELGWYGIDEIKEASENKALPMIVRIVAKSFIKAYDDCDYNKIREIMQHTIGMPKQDIGIVDREITGITFDDDD